MRNRGYLTWWVGGLLLLSLFLAGVAVVVVAIQRANLGHKEPVYTPKELYSRAIDQVDHGQYVLAEQYLEQALAKEDDATYRSQLAVVKYRLKEYPEAIDEYKKLAESKQDLGFVYNGIGNAYRDWGAEHIDQAIAAYQQAITTDPKYASAYSNLALLYASQGRTAQAIALLDQGYAATGQGELLQVKSSITNRS